MSRLQEAWQLLEWGTASSPHATSRAHAFAAGLLMMHEGDRARVIAQVVEILGALDAIEVDEDEGAVFEDLVLALGYLRATEVAALLGTLTKYLASSPQASGRRLALAESLASTLAGFRPTPIVRAWCESLAWNKKLPSAVRAPLLLGTVSADPSRIGRVLEEASSASMETSESVSFRAFLREAIRATSLRIVIRAICKLDSDAAIKKCGTALTAGKAPLAKVIQSLPPEFERTSLGLSDYVFEDLSTGEQADLPTGLQSPRRWLIVESLCGESMTASAPGWGN